MAYTWSKRASDYEVDLDHFALCRSANPNETAAKTPPPVVSTATGQVIPGRLECAFYDLGVKAWRIMTPNRSILLAVCLNQEKTTSARLHSLLLEFPEG